MRLFGFLQPDAFLASDACLLMLLATRRCTPGLVVSEAIA